jgi:hypothetical protein
MCLEAKHLADDDQNVRGRRGDPVFPVSPIMLLKIHVEKMSLLRFAIMFMKTHGLAHFTIMLLKWQQVRRW